MTTRIRITFSKTGALRYTGHLDLHSLWERATRRAGVALAYSNGYHPQPKIQLASALPLGFSSRCEMLDMWLDTDRPENLQIRLQAALPPGLVIHQIENVDERAPALQTQVIGSDFEVSLLDELDLDALSLRLSTLNEAESLPRERRGKTYDLRPLIEELTLTLTPAPSLHMRLSAQPSATGRPEEVLAALEIPFETTRIERTRLIFRNSAS